MQNLTDGREGVVADELAVEPEEHDVDEAEREADERQLVQARQRRAQTAMQQSASANRAVSYIISPHITHMRLSLSLSRGRRARLGDAFALALGQVHSARHSFAISSRTSDRDEMR